MTQFTIVVDCNDPQYTRELCAAFALFPEVKAVLPEDPAAREAQYACCWFPDPQLLAQVAPENYRARIERIYRFHLQAFDWNCPQHIIPRYTARQVAEYSQTLQQRIDELERENQRLQQLIYPK